MIKMLYTSGKPDADRRGCPDCYYCQAAITWWCINEEAIEARKTPFPGVHSCEYWKPIKAAPKRSWWSKWFDWDYDYDYLEIALTEKEEV